MKLWTPTVMEQSRWKNFNRECSNFVVEEVAVAVVAEVVAEGAMVVEVVAEMKVAEMKVAEMKVAPNGRNAPGASSLRAAARM